MPRYAEITHVVSRDLRKKGMALWLPLVIVAGVFIAGCDHTPEGDPLNSAGELPEWQLLWQDEFEGPAGQLPDPSRWVFDVGGSGWGNNQLEYDTNRPENVSLDGQGHLAITARKEPYGGRDYTSGRITTNGRFGQEYGRFEARIRLPVGQGIWPAFWMLGNNFDSVGWPDCGEIDIMEYRGQEPHIVHGSLHGPGYSGGGAVGGRFVLDGERFNDDFHVFGVEWDDKRITWTVDGTAYQTITPNDLPYGRRWVFDHPFFIILNVAVGGNFVGSPDAGTFFPQTMLVDWVRVYGYGAGS
jgi:beta-glucanase (GH16 family)